MDKQVSQEFQIFILGEAQMALSNCITFPHATNFQARYNKFIQLTLNPPVD